MKFPKGATTMRHGSKALHIYNVSKEDVLNKNYDGILSFVKVLDKLGGRKSFGNAMILIDGYNEVVEELHEIPEVREYMEGLFDLIPHILYYINFDLEGHKYMLLCISDSISVFPIGKKSIVEIYNEIGGDYTKVPKFASRMNMSAEQVHKIGKAIIAHSIKVKREDLGMKCLYRIEKMFDGED